MGVLNSQIDIWLVSSLAQVWFLTGTKCLYSGRSIKGWRKPRSSSFITQYIPFKNKDVAAPVSRLPSKTFFTPENIRQIGLWLSCGGIGNLKTKSGWPLDIIQMFWQKWILLGLNIILMGFRTFKMSLWWAVLIAIFHTVKLKTFSRKNTF
jgi:hypothetical protein